MYRCPNKWGIMLLERTIPFIYQVGSFSLLLWFNIFHYKNNKYKWPTNACGFSFSAVAPAAFLCPFSPFQFVHFTSCSTPSLSFYLFSPLQSPSFLVHLLFTSRLPAVREKFLTEIQSPRYARLRDWHHDRSARALNIKSWATSQTPWDAEPSQSLLAIATLQRLRDKDDEDSGLSPGS